MFGIIVFVLHVFTKDETLLSTDRVQYVMSRAVYSILQRSRRVVMKYLLQVLPTFYVSLLKFSSKFHILSRLLQVLLYQNGAPVNWTHQFCSDIHWAVTTLVSLSSALHWTSPSLKSQYTAQLLEQRRMSLSLATPTASSRTTGQSRRWALQVYSRGRSTCATTPHPTCSGLACTAK